MILLACILIGLSNGANVLIYNPMYGQSHINLFGSIADILSRAGHNVTVFSTEIMPDLKPFGTTEQNIHRVALGMKKGNDQTIKTDASISEQWDHDDVIAFKPSDLSGFYDCVYESHEVLLKNKELIRTLQDSKFDVAIHEFYDIGAAAVMELFKVEKVILASAIGDILPYTYEVTGIPHFESFVPAWLTVFGDNLTMWERFQTVRTVQVVKRIVKENEEKVERLFRIHHHDFPNPKELLLKKSGLVLANVNEFTQTPRPISSMIQFIGGSTLFPPKRVDKYLDGVLDSRKYNVLFSLGSYVKLTEAPTRIKQLFVDAFTSMKDVTFIVKCENNSRNSFDFNAYDNIIAKPWLPQNDLLGDERVNVFITHGGMNSITEGQYRGKPMICIPVFADQILNAMSAVKAGSAVLIDKRFISKEELVSKIRSLLSSESSHVKKAKFIQKSLEGREEEYRQKIVKWVELQAEAEKPFDHLILHSRNLSAIELYNLDILGAVIVIVLVILGTSLCLLKSLLSFLKPSTNKTKKA